jgi:hypothetical protein
LHRPGRLPQAPAPAGNAAAPAADGV